KERSPVSPRVLVVRCIHPAMWCYTFDGGADLLLARVSVGWLNQADYGDCLLGHSDRADSHRAAGAFAKGPGGVGARDRRAETCRGGIAAGSGGAGTTDRSAYGGPVSHERVAAK